jgi:hypothetical protein
LVIKHIAGEKNDADIFTKNTTSAVFDRHVPMYVGLDEYVGMFCRQLKFAQTQRGEVGDVYGPTRLIQD